MKRLLEVERDGDRRVGMRNRLAAVRTALGLADLRVLSLPDGGLKELDPWTIERSIREGYLDVCTNDVERLTGRKARSVREMIEANAGLLKAAKA